MIRPMQTTDAADLLALLHWMDDAPEREVFAPDARDARELLLECEDSAGLVHEDEEGVRAYCALSPFRDGLVLDGPLGDGGPLSALVGRAVQGAEGLPVYAFCARDNQGVRDALEAEGFLPMHTTDFYSSALEPLARRAVLPASHQIRRSLPISEYRALYRASEDTWAGRLDWTPEQYDAHFAQSDVRLIALLREGQTVGFAELEFNPDDARADVTYLAVHPAERGQRYGQLLLALAAAEAQTHPELRRLRTRAHDHMQPARALYTHAGLTHCRSVVTYLRDGDEEV